MLGRAGPADDPPPVDDGAENGGNLNYLTAQTVLRLHARVVGCSLHDARLRLLQPARLESAVMRPQNAAHYENADVPLQATYLAHGIAEGQLFLDGNKRTALVAMETFLQLNGYRLTTTDDDLADWILDLDRGIPVEEFAERVRRNTEPFLSEEE